MNFFDAFKKLWGSAGTVDDGLSDAQYQAGWDYIGSTPPELGQFNKREKLIDEKIKWLYEQLETAADANGVTLAGADVGGLLAILQDLIGDHASASDPHAQYQLESGMSAYATLANPALTGTPTAPTATAGTNTKQIATTEFVRLSFPASLTGSNGYQKLPSGLIIQWGSVGCPANYVANTRHAFTLPIAFPSSALRIILSNDGDNNLTPGTQADFISRSHAEVVWSQSSVNASGLAASYVAFGF